MHTNLASERFLLDCIIHLIAQINSLCDPSFSLHRVANNK